MTEPRETCRPHQWELLLPSEGSERRYREGVWQTGTGATSYLTCRDCGLQIPWIPLLEMVLAKFDELVRGRSVAMIEEVEEAGILLRSMYQGAELDKAYKDHIHEAIVKMATDLIGIISIDLVVIVGSLRGPEDPPSG